MSSVERRIRINGGEWDISLKPGSLAPGDTVVRVRTRKGDWVKVEMVMLAIVIRELYLNEDRIRPPTDGWLGGEMLMQFLRDALTMPIESAFVQNFNLRKNRWPLRIEELVAWPEE